LARASSSARAAARSISARTSTGGVAGMSLDALEGVRCTLSGWFAEPDASMRSVRGI
jgi:hypothetical protein